MSLADIDTLALSFIAETCTIYKSRIKDVYSFIPLQSSMIAKNRNEMFHFVLSPSRPVGPDPLCDALRQAVMHNEILRTRIVNYANLGTVNILTDEEHVTNRDTGYDNIEDYLRADDDAPHQRFETGDLLFRSACVGQNAVLTLHHAIMDYWTIENLIQLDLSVVYAGHPPIKCPVFKEFVKYCSDMDDEAARAFWMPRFKGAPAIFPEPRSAQSPQPRVSERTVRHMALQRRAGHDAIASSHMPFSIEAAWALNTAIYTNSESVAYGLVLSGRSKTGNGIENTLGPTVTEVPVQALVRHQTMTVDNLIKDRAMALRQLQQHPAEVQYGVEKIGALSESARVVARFQTLINIRPAVFTVNRPDDTTNDVRIKMRMVWRQGYYPLQFIFSIMDDGVTVWARADSTVINDRQLDLILNQYEHTLRLLTEVPLQTRLAKLPLLDSQFRVEVFGCDSTPPATSDKSIVEALDQRAQSQDLAVEAVDGIAMHLALHCMSDHIAEQLQQRGVLPGARVGFLFKKSLLATAALVRLLRAGGICVPIEEYDEALLSSVGAQLLVTSPDSYAEVSKLTSNVFVVAPDLMKEAAISTKVTLLLNDHAVTTQAKAARRTAVDLTHILFTTEGSGAPQTPVMLSHSHLVSVLTSYVHQFDWQADCRIVQFSPYISSQSMLESFGTLITGGCVCVPRDDEINLPAFITSA
jgi:hypothetical protein